MIIDGKKIADAIQDDIASKISLSQGRTPCLAVILVGDHAPSHIYVGRKTKACQEVGIRSLIISSSSTITEKEIMSQIDTLNADKEVDGILVQLPLPEHINPIKVMHRINPEKDVDGFHPLNIGKMLMGETDGFFPCTPLGIQTMLEKSNIQTSGKKVLIIGRSNIVGKPLAALLMQNSPAANATVTIANSRTENLQELSLMHDIIVTALGVPEFLKASMVKESAVVIDVGINKINDKSKKSGYRIVGDADFEQLIHKCSAISPVPGGVGPMTIAMLLSNTLKSYQKRNS